MMQIDEQWLAQKFPELTHLTPLGQGGQKVVFSADHAVDGSVVLKLIKPTLSVESVNREILAVQKVRSGRVPRILATGLIRLQVGDCIWLREQRIDGEPLRQTLGRGALPERDVLRLGLQMLEALAAAEAVNIVHRDVKPDNIMVDRRNDFWLLDFGLARHLTLDSLTATQAAWGKFTLGYAPTEQFRNDKPNIDGRADLFALGVTLHECLTGMNAFRSGARNQMDIIRRVERLQLPPLQMKLATAADVSDFVVALTQKRRDRRPPNVAYALTWMQGICGAEGI